MRRTAIAAVLLLLLTQRAMAAEGLIDPGEVTGALPEAAAALMEGRTAENPGELGAGIGAILSGAAKQSGGAVRRGLRLFGALMAVGLLSAVLRGSGSARSGQAMELAGTLAVGALCLGEFSGCFSQAAETVDAMTAFSGFLFSALATLTAASGAAGAAASIYGLTVLGAGVMTRLVTGLLLPGIACELALILADSAVGDGGLKIAGDTLRQLLVSFLKLAVLGFTAYLFLTGVVSGSADSAAVKAAKLTISSAVPVVGSMIADASETLLVSAGMLRSGVGIFGLLGVLAVSILPFLEAGIPYLVLKAAGAAAGLMGERHLAALLERMSGAMGLLAGLTAACAAILMVSCVCFMRASA